MKQSKEFKDGYQMGYSAGIAMASQTELKTRQKERERIIKEIGEIPRIEISLMDGSKIRAILEKSLKTFNLI